jgi:hypothetical protein
MRMWVVADRTLAAVCLAGATLAQAPTAEPVLRAVAAPAAFAASGTAAAWDWLLNEFLPQRPEWPVGLAVGRAIALEWRGDRLTIAPATPTLPPGSGAAGSFAFGDGPVGLWSCQADGVEDWFLPPDFAVPAAWQGLLPQLATAGLDQPHRVDVAVLVGHLASALVDADPRATLLRVGASHCGETTWLAWRSPTHLRVRGGSGGGLVLPAALLAIAVADGHGTAPPLPLRAFASRDGDRHEAARQLLRSDAATAGPTLRALLHGDDDQRLVAIDALVRRGATHELPRIVAAAQGHPRAALAAGDAVQQLFAAANPIDRQRTRAALARASDPDLRSLDVDALLGRQPPRSGTDDGSQRARWLLLLGCLGVLLYGLWLRERHRRAAQTIVIT